MYPKKISTVYLSSFARPVATGGGVDEETNLGHATTALPLEEGDPRYRNVHDRRLESRNSEQVLIGVGAEDAGERFDLEVRRCLDRTGVMEDLDRDRPALEPLDIELRQCALEGSHEQLLPLDNRQAARAAA